MAVKIYKDAISQEIEIETVSKEFPSTYEITYNGNLVAIKNLIRKKNDVNIDWSEIRDVNGDVFANLAALQLYLDDLLISSPSTSLGRAIIMDWGLLWKADGNLLSTPQVGDIIDAYDVDNDWRKVNGMVNSIAGVWNTYNSGDNSYTYLDLYVNITKQ